MTDTEAERRLAAILTEYQAAQCPECGRPIGLGDVAWNNGANENGTPYCVVEIQCAACDAEIAHLTSWYGITDYEDLLFVLEIAWDRS